MDDLLHKLDGPEQWWFEPLIWAGALAAIALVLAYYGVNHLEPALIFSAVQGGGRRLIDEPKNAKLKV